MLLIAVCAVRALSCVKDGDALADWDQRLEVPAGPCTLHLPDVQAPGHRGAGRLSADTSLLTWQRRCTRPRREQERPRRRRRGSSLNWSAWTGLSCSRRLSGGL